MFIQLYSSTSSYQLLNNDQSYSIFTVRELKKAPIFLKIPLVHTAEQIACTEKGPEPYKNSSVVNLFLNK
jgi:hypothetical protein